MMMYGFILEQDGVEKIVKIGSFDSPAAAESALNTYAHDWAVNMYGADAQRADPADGTPTADQIVTEATSGAVIVKRYVRTTTVGWFSGTSAHIVAKQLARLRVVPSDCIAHADHSKLVDIIADEVSTGLRYKTDLEAEMRAHKATKAYLAEMTTRAQQSSAACAEVLNEYTAVKQALTDMTNDRDWCKIRMENRDERLAAAEKDLLRTRERMRNYKLDFRARIRAMQEAANPEAPCVDAVSADACADAVGHEETACDEHRNDEHRNDEHRNDSMSVSNIELLRELTTKRPRLRTRDERDAIRARNKY